MGGCCVTAEELKQRTKQFALRAIRLVAALPNAAAAWVIGKQLLRSATSVGANYRAACRGRSGAEWYAKICICVEEADETQFWLELLADSEIFSKPKLAELEQEYLEIVSVLAAARKSYTLRQ